MSFGSNVRDLNWEEIDQSALTGAGDVVTRVGFWHRSWFISLLFGLTLIGIFATSIIQARISSAVRAADLLSEFSREVATLETLDSNLQLEFILRERSGFQGREELVRKADKGIALRVGQAWTAVRRAALIPEIDSALIRRGKSEADKGRAVLLAREVELTRVFKGSLATTGALLMLTMFIAVNALGRRSTTLVVQSLGPGSGSRDGYADISARSFQESEAITRAVNNLPAAIVEFESDGRILRWNLHMQKLTGVASDYAVGRSVIECVQWGATREAAKSTIRRVFSGEQVPKLEWTMKHALGENLELEATILPVVDGGGAVRSAAVVVRDVTSEKYGRELLVANDVARLAVIRALPQTLLRFDSGLNLVEIHDNSDLFSGDLSQIRGSKWQEVFGPELAGQISEAAKNAKLTRLPASLTFSGELAGNSVCLEIRVAVAGPADVLAVVSRQSGKRELAGPEDRSESRLQGLFEGSVDTVMLLSAGGKILYASPSAEHILGLAPDSVIGTDWDHLLDSESRQEAAAAWTTLLSEPTGSVHFVAEFGTEFGTRTAEITARNLLEDESVGAILFNVRDISDRRNHEVEVCGRLEEFGASNDQIGDATRRDPLSGALNFQAVSSYLDAICDYSSTGGAFTAMLFDVDGFMTLNSEIGQVAGDQLLRDLSVSIQEASREDDILGRAGANEFLLILPEANEEVAERVKASVIKGFSRLTAGVATLRVASVKKRSQQVESADLLRELNQLLAEDGLDSEDSAA